MNLKYSLKYLRNTKAQVSIELLFILAIIILLAIIVGVFYFNSLKTSSKNATDTEQLNDSLEDSMETFNENTQANNCFDADIHCSNGVKDCDETGIDSGGSCS